MRLLELTMPLDHQWMPDEIFPTATRVMLAPRGDPEKGITVGTESGTAPFASMVSWKLFRSKRSPSALRALLRMRLMAWRPIM